VEEAEPATEQPADVDKAEPAAPTVAALSEQPPLEEAVPDPVETVAPDVPVPLPQPKPVETEIKAAKPVEAKTKAEKKPVEKPKQRPKKEKSAPPKAVTTASIEARAGAKAAAPHSSDAAPRSSVGPSRWNSSLAAWIRRHTRYPSAARSRKAEGSPNVTFTVDASGRVVSARLARLSGDADLDRAALGALQGASVPAPPAELGARVTRTAPFVFSLRD
ncbi:MAG: energy transducer TonB, partial [Mesorhizobium sp.]